MPPPAPLSALIVLGATLLLTGCDRLSTRAAAAVPGGDPTLGREALRTYGCVSCHTIPGVRGADALVGPPLDRIGARVYLAGRLTNTPAHLIRWIRHPREVDPQTAMPDTGVTEKDARHIASYLYTLR